MTHQDLADNAALSVAPRLTWGISPIVLLTGILLAFACFFYPTLNVWYERDEGEYAYAADLLASGQLPYRDCFLQKPPGIIALYYLVHQVLGPGPRTLHLVTMLAYGLMIVLVFWIAGRLVSKSVAIAAAAFTAAQIVVPAYQSYPANTEVFLTTCVTIAYALLIPVCEGGGSLGRQALFAALSGLALGCGLSFKQVGLFHGVQIGLMLVLARGSWREQAMRGTVFSIMAAAPLGIALAYWWWRGALYPFLDGVLLHNIEYASINPEGTFWRMLTHSIRRFWGFPSLLWAMAWFAMWTCLRRQCGWKSLFVLGWLVTALMGLSVGGYFRGHYFIQSIPCFAIASAIALTSVRTNLRPFLVTAAIAMFLAARPFFVFDDIADQSKYRYGGMRFHSSAALAQLMRQVASGPDATVFVLGSEPQLLHYSGLRSITRYVIFNPLFGGFLSSRQRQEEVWATVKGHPPELIVLSNPGGVPMFSHSDFYLYEQVLTLITDQYEPVAKTMTSEVGLVDPFRPDSDGNYSELYLYRRRRQAGIAPTGYAIPRRDDIDLYVAIGAPHEANRKAIKRDRVRRIKELPEVMK